MGAPSQPLRGGGAAPRRTPLIMGSVKTQVMNLNNRNKMNHNNLSHKLISLNEILIQLAVLVKLFAL